MKRLLFLSTILLLTSCQRGGSNPIVCTTRTQLQNFSVCIPDGFVMAESMFGDQGSSILTFRKVGSDDLPLYIHVKHEPLLSPVSSPMEFAKRGRRIAVEQAPSYTLVSLSDITVDGSATLFHTFTAEPVEEEGVIAYYQTVIPFGNVGHGFSATRQREPRGEDGALARTIFESIRFEEEVSP